MKSIFHVAVLAVLLCFTRGTTAAKPFRIRVVDEVTGRGVPLVELTTVNNVRYVTDSAGVVAFDDASLMGQQVFFHVKSHGYEYPAGPFGSRGRSLNVSSGKEATLKIKRINIAERLYRMTGAGTYQDSVRLGDDVPIDRPLLNAGVLGSDSVVNAVFNGRIYWFWGDTNHPQHPLGNFHVPGATSQLPQRGGLDPAVGVNLEYFLNEKGQAKQTCPMPGEGPTWIGGLTVLTDEDGHERLFAHYVKVRPQFEVYARGLCEFDPAAQAFRQLRELPFNDPLHPTGHPVRVTDEGVEFIYFAHPFPYTRVRATVDSYLDPSQYEAYTCLKAGEDPKSPEVHRTDEGRPDYAWRRGGLPFNMTLTKTLVEQGKLTAEESAFLLHDRETGKMLQAHGGSLYWNEYRRRWVMIVLETWGKTLLGEIWYAEADTPLGPWSNAVKIVTHDNYSFYNPKQHPMFDQDGGRLIYFEGTYTHTFTNNPDQTPRYDYNQIMYRLDLSDKRLELEKRN